MGVWRCAMLTAMQCGTYDRAKEAAGHLLGTSQTDVGTHFAASLASGIASTTATVPFDNVKTIQIVQRLPSRPGSSEGGTSSYLRIAAHHDPSARSSGCVRRHKGTGGGEFRPTCLCSLSIPSPAVAATFSRHVVGRSLPASYLVCSVDQHMSNIEQFVYLGTESNCVIACTQRTDGRIERKQVVPLPNPLGLKHGTPGGVAVEWVTAHPSGVHGPTLR